ncbi:ABC transporter permease [Malacoplasma iowae]|uniref:ABC transporter permease n=1 Tax=Malacoplasma iowae TaxID=2116 RepID=UPI003873C229|nr:ABC transporter permease [Malacoplasma iowae]
MKELMKNVLKSFKSSFLLITALVFILFSIIFSSLSLSFLNDNLQSSINSINAYGNSANTIVEQNYQTTAPIYSVDEKLTPTKQKTYVSKFVYQTSESQNNNVLFPYLPNDFSNSLVNSKPWEYRKKGILRANGSTITNLNGENDFIPKNINTSDHTKWFALGWSFANASGIKLFDPNNLIFVGNNISDLKLGGYFNETAGQVDELITFNESNYVANKNDWTDIYALNNATVATSGLEGTYKNRIVNLPTSTLLKNVVSVTRYAELYDALFKNVEMKEENFYTLTLNYNNLSSIQKQVIDKFYTKEQKDNILNKKVLIKDSWLDESLNTEKSDVNKRNELLKNWLQKIASQESKKLNKELSSKYDLLSEKFLKEKNINFDKNKSFTLPYSDSSISYLVSRKGNETIDRIVYSSGSRLQNSTKYLDMANAVNNVITTTDNYQYLYNLLYLMLSSTATTGNQYIQNIYSKGINVLQSLEQGLAVDNSNYSEFFAIYQPNITFQSLIETKYQRVDIKTTYLDGIDTFPTDNTFSVFDPYSFATIVPEKYLVSNNKSILPISVWNDILTKSSSEIKEWLNNLDSKYYFKVNTLTFVIIGSGISPEMVYPSSSLDNIIINPRDEVLLYVNEQGYQSILNTQPTLFENKYYAAQINKGSTQETNKYISKLNSEYRSNFNQNSNSNLVYNINNFNDNKNILTFRIILPSQIKSYISTVAITIIIILVVIGIYLTYLLVKTYINRNIIQLAIIKANGFSNLKITLGMSLFGLFVSIIGGIFGYIGALFLQTPFLQVVGAYWFISISLSPFSVLTFIATLIITFVLFFIFSYFILTFKFKTPIAQLISQNTEMKANKILNWSKSNLYNSSSPLIKFRLNLSFSNFSRFIFYTLLCSIGLSFITGSIALRQKFEESQYQTSLNKQYDYRFDLTTPTEQSGLYKYQKYSELGFSDPDIGIYPIYKGNINNKNYEIPSIYNYPYKLDQLKVYDPETNMPKKDKNGNQIYYGNILLPSYNANLMLERDLNFSQNVVLSKWLLDFNFAVVGINPWQFVKESLPQELVAKVETQSNNFLKAIYNSDNKFIKKDLAKNHFIIYNSSTNIYSLNSDAVVDSSNLNPSQIRFNDKFLKFIGEVYGIKELSEQDVKLSYGIVPYDDESETFSYIDATASINRKIMNIKIIGVNKDSKMIKLRDEKNELINNLLDEPNTIIVNNGAAYKYKIKVGDKINFNVNNSYYRYTKKIFEDENIDITKLDSKNNKTFKVVGIATSSFGEEFYTSQESANDAIGINFNLSNPQDEARIISHNKIVSTNKIEKKYIDNSILEKRGYVPFNGIISNSKDPILLNKSLVFYSLLGTWPNISKFGKSSLLNFVNQEEWQDPDKKSDSNYSSLKIKQSDLIFQSLAPYNISNILENDKTKFNNIANNLLKKHPSYESISNYIVNIFGNTPINVSLVGLDSNLSNIEIYNSIINTIKIVQVIGMSIVIPIIVIMIFVLTSLMMNDIKKIISILKTLGYSDKENIISVLSTYIPVIIFGLLIGLAVFAISMVLIQFAVYSISSIFISSSVSGLPYLYGALGIISILFINFVIMIFTLKKANLKTVINYLE